MLADELCSKDIEPFGYILSVHVWSRADKGLWKTVRTLHCYKNLEITVANNVVYPGKKFSKQRSNDLKDKSVNPGAGKRC